MTTKNKPVGLLQSLGKYYDECGRNDLPWRQPEPAGSFDPYKILVSEIMLQQTQVPRVISKYKEFITAFPTVEDLAKSELGQILRVWSGLGYNRRAKYLHETAKQLTTLGYFPETLTQLVKLPGVGKNTGGAILAYAFNKPVHFIETNIRTVYIHHYFAGKTGIPDTDIIKLLEETLDTENPREFYWALMDYGSQLKREIGNLSKLSKHYVRQSSFQDSQRQIRGQVIRLLNGSSLSLTDLIKEIGDARLGKVLENLVAEGLIHQAGQTYSL